MCTFVFVLFFFFFFLTFSSIRDIWGGATELERVLECVFVLCVYFFNYFFLPPCSDMRARV